MSRPMRFRRRDRAVLVRVDLSAVSAGTELLVYRGQVPADMPLDANLPALIGALRFPLRYGYAAAGEDGRGTAGGPGLARPPRLLFSPARQPSRGRPRRTHPDSGRRGHARRRVPRYHGNRRDLDDGRRPAIGERVVVFGQGVVGLLATALLSRYPLKSLFSVDPFARRRHAALAAGAQAVFDPAALEALNHRLQEDSGGAMADLVFELSETPRRSMRPSQLPGSAPASSSAPGTARNRPP